MAEDVEHARQDRPADRRQQRAASFRYRHSSRQALCRCESDAAHIAGIDLGYHLDAIALSVPVRSRVRMGGRRSSKRTSITLPRTAVITPALGAWDDSVAIIGQGAKRFGVRQSGVNSKTTLRSGVPPLFATTGILQPTQDVAHQIQTRMPFAVGAHDLPGCGSGVAAEQSTRMVSSAELTPSIHMGTASIC